MKSILVISSALVCALFSLISCNVAVPVSQDGGGKGGEGKDQGVIPEQDGGGKADGGKSDGGIINDGGSYDAGPCPLMDMEPMYPCATDQDCPVDYVCKPIFDDRPECGGSCQWIDILTDGGPYDGGCPEGSGPATCASDPDCPQGSFCREYVTGRPECGTYCTGVPIDGGPTDSGPGCINPCDCPYGMVCESGLCGIAQGGPGTVFCCDRPCPTGAPCQHAGGAYDKCQGDADVGYPDAGSCVGEGSEINKTGDPNPPQCCPGLMAIPLMAVDTSSGGCAMPGCDCVVCAQQCGNGTCTAGKNACNCAKDCPLSFTGGPGSKCTVSKDCTAGGSCYPEQYGFPTGGYCMGDTCDPMEVPGPCPAGSVCTPMMISQALGHCMPSCREDADCRAPLTCEWMPSYRGTEEGRYICWQGNTGGLGKALGETCTADTGCLSALCKAGGSGGAKKCVAYCDDLSVCKDGLICKPMSGCNTPGCGACF